MGCPCFYRKAGNMTEAVTDVMIEQASTGVGHTEYIRQLTLLREKHKAQPKRSIKDRLSFLKNEISREEATEDVS